MRKSLLRAATLAAAALLALAPTGGAGAMVVYDPTNYAQNVLQAARALEQVRNQISSLQNEAQMILNQSRNLSSLPLSTVEALNRDMAAIRDLLAKADRIAYDVQAVEREFTRHYPDAIAAGTSDAQMVAAARERWLNSARAFQHALSVQAGVVASLPSTRSQTGALVSASQGAVGVLQATQAGNQLLAVQAKQLADVTALLAAQGRAQALEQARQAQSEAQAREQLRRFLGKGAQ